ncbi:hypothetical protein NKG94_27085 [Micromonospora sp. M12]
MSFEEQVAGDPQYFTGWTLGSSSADLDGDLLPELYLANDFGHDRFFHNRSTPGGSGSTWCRAPGPDHPEVPGARERLVQGMSIDFADLEGAAGSTRSSATSPSPGVWRRATSSGRTRRRRRSRLGRS